MLKPKLPGKKCERIVRAWGRMEELRERERIEERRLQGGGREDKGWMNNAFAKGRKQHAAGRRFAKGKN